MAFFVDTQNHRVIRWIQIKADDVVYLLNKEGIS